MSHFAEVKNNLVVNVICATQEFVDELPSEAGASWVQTSYNTRGGVHYAPNSNTPDDGVALRKNYAGIGMTYDSVRDAFYDPQPYPSWTLDEDSCTWEPPSPRPEDGFYYWDEPSASWKEV